MIVNRVNRSLVILFNNFPFGRFSPYEWDNPHPCNEQEVSLQMSFLLITHSLSKIQRGAYLQVLVNEFSLVNTMWFAVGSLMQRGSDIVPK